MPQLVEDLRHHHHGHAVQQRGRERAERTGHDGDAASCDNGGHRREHEHTVATRKWSKVALVGDEVQRAQAERVEAPCDRGEAFAGASSSARSQRDEYRRVAGRDECVYLRRERL